MSESSIVTTGVTTFSGGAGRVITKKRTEKPKPIRVLLHGAPKVGKTTFAACAKNAVILGDEDGADGVPLDVDQMPVKTWNDVLDNVDQLTNGNHGFKTLVLDTLDWLEPLVWDYTCGLNSWKTIEDPGYGKGYERAIDTWRVFIKKLEHLREKRGMAIIVLCHTTTRTVANPVGADHDRAELKINKKAASLWAEWVDVIGYAQKVADVTKDGKPTANQKDTRLLHLHESPAWLAGSRFQLPSPLPLDFSRFREELVSATKLINETLANKRAKKEDSNAAA